jgi:hypothetical protein
MAAYAPYAPAAMPTPAANKFVVERTQDFVLMR